MPLADTRDVKRLADSLQQNPAIAKYPSVNEEPAGWRIANGLAHLESSAHEFLAHVAALVSASAQSEQDELLSELREDLRHMLYHVRDTPYFDVLMSSGQR